mmetsp:Transcript_6212/g.10328  ORF Transcript_6212/g.10328 Transcript_6212/m.10328 type:complete len:355 (+) Transcript_6212:172-1236(+)
MWQFITKNLNVDADEIFAYDSVKLVRVLDYRLGLVNRTMQFLITCYVVLYVFIIEKQYLDFEKTSGWILVRAMNQQKSDLGVTWDMYDRITNPGEQGAIFIPTRILVTKGQVDDANVFCESFLHPCTQPDDCDIDNSLLQKKECVNGHCMRRQWCPAENPAVPSVTETHYLQLSEVELWFKAYVHFHKFSLDVATTDEKTEVMYPMKKANTYPLHDLLRMANLETEELIENGAVIMANVVLTCDFWSERCRSKVEVVNVDTKSGYNYVHARKYVENGVRKQDTIRMYGIRLTAFATGNGAMPSFSQIVLQVSSAIALLMLAQTTADIWLMHVVPERKHYTEQKVIQTEDFNEDS